MFYISNNKNYAIDEASNNLKTLLTNFKKLVNCDGNIDKLIFKYYKDYNKCL
jgi:hypothetical protein